MTEQLQTRTEHSRSLEDIEKYKALNTLRDVGLLIPVDDLETFHGRVSTSEDANEWFVDPMFANGGNDSGNRNVNSRPTLYTAEKDIAEEFALRRATKLVRSRYNKVYEAKVEAYTTDERQAWLDRANAEHQEWFDSLDPDSKPYYGRFLDEDGGLKPKTFDDLRLWQEARRIERLSTEEEKNAAWESVSGDVRAHVHDIVISDSDASVLDLNFSEQNLDEEALAKYRRALKVLAIPTTEGSPAGFDNRDMIRPFVDAVINHNKPLVTHDDVRELAGTSGVDEAVFEQLAGAFNARQISTANPAYLAQKLVNNSSDMITTSMGTSSEPRYVPVNLEYVQRLFQQAHIVGVKQALDSATLNKDIEAVSFFELEKSATTEGLDAKRQATHKKLGGIASTFEKPVGYMEQTKIALLRVLDDAHAKPDKIVDAAKTVDGYEDIFNADAGNWEGFTLAEHTETVLRNFDETYADELPVALLAPMRLAILVHDIGKPTAAAEGLKHRQKEYNAIQAEDFMDKIGVEDRLSKLVTTIIGEGAELAFEIEVRGAGKDAIQQMATLAQDAMQEYFGVDEITGDQVEGFIEMCNMLQVCDGGAYTSIAVTRRAGKGRFRNAPSFNASFANPGSTKRKVRPRLQGKQAAAHDLTPKVRV